jgi:hypothetical protein
MLSHKGIVLTEKYVQDVSVQQAFKFSLKDIVGGEGNDGIPDLLRRFQRPEGKSNQESISLGGRHILGDLRLILTDHESMKNLKAYDKEKLGFMKRLGVLYNVDHYTELLDPFSKKDPKIIVPKLTLSEGIKDLGTWLLENLTVSTIDWKFVDEEVKRDWSSCDWSQHFNVHSKFVALKRKKEEQIVRKQQRDEVVAHKHFEAVDRERVAKAKKEDEKLTKVRAKKDEMLKEKQRKVEAKKKEKEEKKKEEGRNK